jgi:hypothetical protein
MAENYLQVGGVRIGKSFWFSFNLTYPFAELEICNEGITLRIKAFFYRREYKFKRDEIKEIIESKGLFSRGIRIIHTNKSYPIFVLFWATNMKELKDNLAAHQLL